METREAGVDRRENQPVPRIRLEFFRHEQKAKTLEGQSDNEVRLTEQGRINATEAGKAKDPHPEVAIAIGSPRDRSTETAMRVMLSKEPGITQEDTLEDIQEFVGDSLKVGRKNMVDHRLDFTFNGEFLEAVQERYGNTKDYLVFAVNESDELAKKLKDRKSTSYTRQAAGIAEIIRKYVDVLPNFQHAIQQSPDKYSKYENEMQRFLGTHAPVSECFLLKIVELTEGKEGLKTFLETGINKNGFNFSEGFSVEIQADGILVRYKGREWNIKPELLDQIIEQRDELDKSIDEAA
ncbi:MAG: hypothetical protein G01um101477_303 [Candidatus Doudnabacteria bacterium Gr01-1014_77]|uniref:Uncharacterized protein n=1 Tax=Candidatus Doudnabacteria bacterium Gr01-1014_77 TaxID=2017133 RepID=A0A554JC70_9BACT|nr:MAG: hypothetical protein G01um101477_303 [Candidatus Doudnabacteria bacterium Gr01-1014_77]